MQSLDIFRQRSRNAVRVVVAEPFPEPFLLLLRIRRIPFAILLGQVYHSGDKHLPLSWDRVAFEPVRDEDFVLLMLIAGGQNISALKSLIEVSEDVEYRDETPGGVSWTSNI